MAVAVQAARLDGRAVDRITDAHDRSATRWRTRRPREATDVPGRLERTSCIVTGAGRGVGRGIALRLAQEGASVCVADIDAESAQRVASQIESDGGSALACLCDVADRESVKRMIDETVRAFGRLDVIFNNAGISEVKLFLDIQEQDWHKIMNVNGLGVLLCMQEAARVMIAQGDGGKIINTASIAGKQGYPGNPHYCASKFAVVALTQAGARTFGKHGITVNSFCPGVVDTELWEQLDAEFLALGETQRPGQAMEEFAAGILLGRVSTPDDIVGLAAFLASHDSDYITGQSIHVDGGMVLV
jgi:meso-butanediol dehydrogenase/(S,S)-butanediol dehydrogenase/diacetyl reductase